MSAFRPPAYPLVTVDPYCSYWSFTDVLTDDTPRHWTGREQGMCGLVRVDGQVFRFCGPSRGGIRDVPVMRQLRVEVHPTQTIYHFEAGGLALTLTFLTPALADDLEWLARPVTYILFEARSLDGREHSVTLYWDVGGEIAADSLHDTVNWGRLRAAGLEVLTFAGTQPVLGQAGDQVRMDWGHAYLAAPAGAGATFLGSRQAARFTFAGTGELPARDDFERQRPVAETWPVMAATLPLGEVGAEPVHRHLILAYDDVFSVEHMHRKLRPWWRRHGADAADLLAVAEAGLGAIQARCREFDETLEARLRERGGESYALLGALAYRQCLAAHKLVADARGELLHISKENSSNGCAATVDVTYPSAPFFLALNPRLLQAQLDPVLEYAASERWKFPFAPHDLGTYPWLNGQTYGGGEATEEDQMPVEECGNMLLLVGALCLREGLADYAEKWWPLLARWAAYLEEKGLDPEGQLCTDDFAGHLAHNTNLSLKSILGLGTFGRLAELTGRGQEAARVRRLAADMARSWEKMAGEADHYRLAFDQPGSWSQKYNLVWDRLLGLDLFSPEVAERELSFYRKQLQEHGLPLDSRRTYTKLDWIFWTACLSGREEDFQALTVPCYRWASAGVSRVPLTDWYETTGEGAAIEFRARSVVGGLFIALLAPLGKPYPK
jgi:hypothetical protein